MQCNLCKADCKHDYYDAAMKSGVWAFMCAKCFRVFGIGLGIGIGQHYLNGKKQPYGLGPLVPKQ